MTPPKSNITARIAICSSPPYLVRGLRSEATRNHTKKSMTIEGVRINLLVTPP
jgi:hypothetical protein